MKTAIEKHRGKWVVRFTQGSQTFTLLRPESKSNKNDAGWQREMLDVCFDNYKREIRAEKIEVEKEIDDITASVCKCKKSTWNNDSGCFICDDCGKRI